MPSNLLPSRQPRVAHVLVAAALAAGASGACKRATPPAAVPPATRDVSAAGRPAYEAIVVRFADQANAGIFAYARREHILEPELAKVNATLEWVSAPGAFSASFDAMNSGAINASGGAISPIIGALSHNLRFKIYGIDDGSNAIPAGIIDPPQSSIRSVKDLVGRHVAVNWAAHGDYILLKAL